MMSVKKFWIYGALCAALVCGGVFTGGCGEEASSGESAVTEAAPPRGEAVVRRSADTVYAVPDGVPVLMYHMIGDEEGNPAVMSEENFRWQMAYLAENGYHPITMQELYDYVTKEAPLPEKPVCITFDDGYEDNYRIVYPLMKSYGFPWTVFVITGHVGQDRRMTWDQLNEMAESRAVTIANHTVDHPDLDTLTESRAEAEIRGAQEALKEHLGIDNRWMAYPNGSFNETVKEAAKRAGIDMGVLMDGGRMHAVGDPYAVTRIWVGNGVWEENYKERLTIDDYTSL